MTDENKVDEPNVQAQNNSLAVGGINVGGNVSGAINVVNGPMIHVEKGATAIFAASAEAVGGLVALSELMKRSPDVRPAVVAFQTDFEVAREQVDLLGDYKDLHDLLHQLQLYCYNSIVEVALRFPDDEMAVDNLTRYAADLERIMEGLQDVAGRLKIQKQDLVWIEDMTLAKSDLDCAIEALDRKLLSTVIWRLNRVLALQPARIDTLLNLAARTLRLPALLSALTKVCDHMSSLELDPDKVLAFQSGLQALSELDRALSELVETHNRWQWLDVELRRVGGSIEQNLVELEMSWPDLKLKAEELYGSSTEEWAEALRKEENALNAVLAGNDPPKKVLSCFHSYQRRTTNRFFRVDSQLKSLCGNLRQIGVPLASVLRMVQ